jgi:hypothetical protein
VTVENFITKWENCSGSERANYAVFLTELANVLGVEAPGPTDDYRIDAPVRGGAEAGGTGFIDLYKRGCFILEAKQSKQVCELPTLPGLEDVSTAQSGAKYDDLMRRAFRQARRYAQSLTQPPWPPFIMVLDVGRAFEIYFDFGGNGRDYRFFPDRLNASADYVMHWWDRAAHMLATDDSPLIRFGFVTTNSITQKLSRKVVSSYLDRGKISLAFAIPDHPWIKKAKEERSKAKGSAREKGKKGPAAVRIAMTVAQRGDHVGRALLVKSEKDLDTDEPKVDYEPSVAGKVNSDLTVGADVTATTSLKANEGVCSPGMKLHGRGFVVSRERARDLGLGEREGLEGHILPYLNGRDLLQRPRGVMVNRLHEQLDQAVADAYGWGDEWRSGALGPSEVVARLVTLNHERAAEEKAGKIRWLRPDYQRPRFGKKQPISTPTSASPSPADRPPR